MWLVVHIQQQNKIFLSDGESGEATNLRDQRLLQLHGQPDAEESIPGRGEQSKERAGVCACAFVCVRACVCARDTKPEREGTVRGCVCVHVFKRVHQPSCCYSPHKNTAVFMFRFRKTPNLPLDSFETRSRIPPKFSPGQLVRNFLPFCLRFYSWVRLCTESYSSPTKIIRHQKQDSGLLQSPQ